MNPEPIPAEHLQPPGNAKQNVVQDSSTVERLLDAALRRLDHQDKTFDSIDTKTGLLFGFSIAATPAAVAALGRLENSEPLQAVVGSGFFLLLCTIAFQCWWTFKTASFQGHPDVQAMINDGYLFEVPSKATSTILAVVADATTKNSRTLATKAERFDRVLFLIFCFVLLLMFAYCIPAVNAWLQKNYC